MAGSSTTSSSDAHDLTEVTILDISDYHGQLTPLTETADTVGPAFAIGGSAFLKEWFDDYEVEAALSSKDGSSSVIEMAAGDSVGATPPISAFFGDTPTIEIMNMMGIDIDGLGNHNFDRGQDYLRHTLIPLARLPVRLLEHRRRQREHAAGVVPVAPLHVRARREARHRRLLER